MNTHTPERSENGNVELADKLESLRSNHRPDWYVDKEPHDYADGTKHFNHVRFDRELAGQKMTVEVAHYVTPDLGDLLCTLHNNLDTIIAALRAPAQPSPDLVKLANEIWAESGSGK